MKFSSFLLSGWGLLSALHGGTEGNAIHHAPVTTIASLPARTPGEAPALPAVPEEKPDFQVESTQVKQLDVVEPPPMPGLPPVEGTITLTVRNVADPELPDPPPLPPARTFQDPATQARLALLREKHRETRVAFVSATVYDRSRTRLTVYPNGGIEKAVTVWSNLDFNHFSGFSCFEAKDSGGETRKYSLLMGVGNVNSEWQRRRYAERGLEFEAPDIPAIPGEEPAFVIVSDFPDSEGVKLVEDLHALYRTEGVRMAEAFSARQQANEERREYLRANPPRPKDVTVHFWKRTKSEVGTDKEGGQP